MRPGGINSPDGHLGRGTAPANITGSKAVSRINLANKMPLSSRTMPIDGRPLPLTLHRVTWQSLEEIAKIEHISLQSLVQIVDDARNPGTDLTTSLEVLAIAYFRDAATEAGHRHAGHGAGRAVARHLATILGGIRRPPRDRP